LQLNEQLCFALYRATNTVTRAYYEPLRLLGLTYPQYLALLALWEDGEQTVRVRLTDDGRKLRREIIKIASPAPPYELRGEVFDTWVIDRYLARQVCIGKERYV
jgi:DNA-binding MarR family transcriptional regulator